MESPISHVNIELIIALKTLWSVRLTVILIKTNESANWTNTVEDLSQTGLQTNAMINSSGRLIKIQFGSLVHY